MGTGAIRMGSFAARDTRERVLTGLFRAHCVELVRLAYCLLGDRGRAEEAVQEAYLSLHRHWPPKDQQSALGYLRAAVINQCRSDQRRIIRARTKEPLIRKRVLGAHWTGRCGGRRVPGRGDPPRRVRP